MLLDLLKVLPLLICLHGSCLYLVPLLSLVTTGTNQIWCSKSSFRPNLPATGSVVMYFRARLGWNMAVLHPIPCIIPNSLNIDLNFYSTTGRYFVSSFVSTIIYWPAGWTSLSQANLRTCDTTYKRLILDSSRRDIAWLIPIPTPSTV